MRAWIVTVGEPLPTDPSGDRLHRAGMISEALTRRGHEVLWWTSTLDHTRKQLRFDQSTTVKLPSGLVLRLLHGVRYSRNISLSRIWNHRQIGARFSSEASDLPEPDVILCSFPIIDLAERSAKFGTKRGVPVVLDVRDLWPDIFPQYLPAYSRPFARILIRPMAWKTRRAFAERRGHRRHLGTVPTVRSFLRRS